MNEFSPLLFFSMLDMMGNRNLGSTSCNAHAMSGIAFLFGLICCFVWVSWFAAIFLFMEDDHPVWTKVLLLLGFFAFTALLFYLYKTQL